MNWSVIFFASALIFCSRHIEDVTPNPDGTDPDTARTAVLVNQVGYDAEGAKRVIVQIGNPEEGKLSGFRLLDESGKTVFQGELKNRGRVHPGTASDWGGEYWTGDFSGFSQKGRFRAQIEAGSRKVESFPFRVESQVLYRRTGEAAVTFFRWQRCGIELPGLHAACHLDDGKMPDELGGGHRDLTGGWHDAGDYNKYILYGGTPLAVYALAQAYRCSAGFMDENVRNAFLDEACWGADFLLKMRIPGEKTLLSCVFSGYKFSGAPERETDNISGTNDDRPAGYGPTYWPKVPRAPSPLSAAALAILAEYVEDKGYREAAEELWLGAVAALETEGGRQMWFAGQGITSDFGQLRAESELLLADLELARLTGDPKYESDAIKRAQFVVDHQGADGSYPSSARGDGMRPASLAMFAKTYPQHAVSVRCRDALKRWLLRNTELTTNPFSLIATSGEAIFQPYKDIKERAMGRNAIYLSRAWALYLTGTVLNDKSAIGIANGQVDWILGMNPLNICMMEGQGSFNLPRYHHRFLPEVEKRGAVPGAIVNGMVQEKPGIDRPFLDLSTSGVYLPAYQTNEPWIIQDSYYILAMVARYFNL